MFRQFIQVLTPVIRQTLAHNPSTVLQRGHKRWVSATIAEINRRKAKLKPTLPDKRSSYLEWNYDAELFSFGKRLGEDFNEDLLKRALTHRSYLLTLEPYNEDESDNKDLILEGGRIIYESLKEQLENRYHPQVLPAVIDHLAKDDMLSHVAFHMGLSDIVLCSDYPPEKTTLADSFRAIVAALHQTDRKRVPKFVNDFLICQLNGKDEYEIWNPTDCYRRIEQMCKSKGIDIEPRLCNSSAINTILANYQVGLYADKKLLGIGWGESVDIAKEMAAFDAIKNVQQRKVTI